MFVPVRPPSPLPSHANDIAKIKDPSPVWIHDLRDLSPTRSGRLQEDIFEFRKHRASTASTLSLILCFLLVSITSLVGVYKIGETRATKVLLNEVDEIASSRDELMQDHHLLLQELDELAHCTSANEILQDDIHNLEHELSVQEAAFKEEVAKRDLTHHEVSIAFGYYQQRSDEQVEMERRRRADLSKMIKTMAYDKYGAGPHYVEFHVRIWNGSESTEGSFVVELAPIELLPATVAFFLEQVTHGLWDDTSFDINTSDMIVAQPSNGRHDHSNLAEMEALGLAHLPFWESSSQVPTSKYAIGYHGGTYSSPSGSFLYLSKDERANNTNGHFGNIVAGFDVADAMASLQVSDNYRIQPVDIISIRHHHLEEHYHSLPDEKSSSLDA